MKRRGFFTSVGAALSGAAIAAKAEPVKAEDVKARPVGPPPPPERRAVTFSPVSSTGFIEIKKEYLDLTYFTIK